MVDSIILADDLKRNDSIDADPQEICGTMVEFDQYGTEK